MCVLWTPLANSFQTALKCKKAVDYTEFQFFFQYTEHFMRKKCNEIHLVEACYEKKQCEYVRMNYLLLGKKGTD